MTDFDPNSVPIRAAATVMMIDDRPDLQLLMMERNANTVFAGGMWVGAECASDKCYRDSQPTRKQINRHIVALCALQRSPQCKR